MPTYNYRCKSCGVEFEEFQSISADALRVCPSCHEETLSRLIGAGAGLVFKGSGFYLTDYKNTNSGGGQKTDSKKNDSKKVEPKTESKPTDSSTSTPKSDS